MLPLKTMLTVGTFSLLMAAPSLIPALQQFQVTKTAALVIHRIPQVWDLPVPFAQEAAARLNMEDLRAARLVVQAREQLIDPNHELDHFYQALYQQAVQKGGAVRVVHFGDSPTTADMITADVRGLLQKQFGDAGAGFLLIAKPWAWYQHRGVTMDAKNWGIDVAGATADVQDGLFGLGGSRVRGNPGAVANWTFPDAEQASVEVSFQARPNGGIFVFEADGQPIGKVDTASPEIRADYATFEIPKGSTKFRLRVESGFAQLFGVEFRTDQPGIIYSSLGINGANVTMVSRTLDKNHITMQLRHYKPDLVVLAYGTNESGFATFVDRNWADEMQAAVKRVRAALPDASILLMSPMDRGEAQPDGSIATIATIPRLVSKEQTVAGQQGVAFFNTYQAMGGSGTMAKWAKAQPRKVGFDYIHPLAPGAKIVGELLYSALHDGFQDYRRRQLSSEAVAAAATPSSNSAKQQ